MSFKNLVLAAAGTAAVLLSGCAKKAAAPAATPVVEVGIVTVAARPLTLSRELPGRTSAYRIAEVRARVSGIVLKRLFTEGAKVKEGDVLYQIDPAPYQAALAIAKAALAHAEASTVSIRQQEERSRELIKAKAISQQGYDNAIAALKASEADIAAAQAAVQAAEINLGYTHVTSPLTGRIGRAEVTEGAYVQQGTATLLATVQQLDRLYVDLTQSSTEVLRLQRALAEGHLTSAGEGAAKVQLLLDGDRVYDEPGSLQFSDVTVNSTTSSISLRALFPNPRGELLPGLFVRARLDEGELPDAILVPQPAVTRNVKGEATALVVGAESKVELRVLQTDRAVGNEWLIRSGLKVGDQLIVENLQRIRPGATVKPVPATTMASTPSAAPAAR
jgi:membrane fusion protein (multidrug efflux system)